MRVRASAGHSSFHRENSLGKCLEEAQEQVKREIWNIFDRLGVNDRAQAVSEAMKRRII
ncbi:MAG: hypothetical protein Q8O43_07500 [Dehalococcoidia bacterium]|nr:hypothetical protein [Dehalococcoidia bacterium]